MQTLPCQLFCLSARRLKSILPARNAGDAIGWTASGFATWRRWNAVLLAIGIAILLGSASPAQEPPATSTQGTEIAGLGTVGAVELVKNGFQFTEGPAKTPDGSVYFTDIPAETIHRLKPDGTVESFLHPSGFANGLLYGGNGQLLACQMDGRLVSIDLTSKQLTVLADTYQGKRFNACNDLVIDKQGGIYFTDPRYKAPEPWPQGTEAFYYRSAAGDITRLGENLEAPNGIGLSPDGQTLYVVQSVKSEVMAYPVTAPGEIGEGRVLCELEQKAGSESIKGGDGMALDIQGNLYITTAAGVQVVSAEGKVLGIIPVPEEPANCGFGGAENKTLFMTARTGLYRCSVPVPGYLPRAE